MRNSRQLVGAFVIAAVMSVSLLGTTASAATSSGEPGGPSRGTCGFLQGILYKMPADVADTMAVLFDALFGCDL
jgi:hypothetical protein